jgi:hypothetical protein
MMMIPMHTDNRIKNLRVIRGIRILNVFIRRSNKLELIALLILPSPLWPIYFVYGESIRRSVRKIISNARKRKQ